MWGWILGIAAVFAAVFFYIYNRKKKCSFMCLDDVVGEKCVVVQTVDNYAGSGLVRVKGTEWSARSVNDDDIYEVGKTLVVVAIEGVKLICKEK